MSIKTIVSYGFCPFTLVKNTEFGNSHSCSASSWVIVPGFKLHPSKPCSAELGLYTPCSALLSCSLLDPADRSPRGRMEGQQRKKGPAPPCLLPNSVSVTPANFSTCSLSSQQPQSLNVFRCFVLFCFVFFFLFFCLFVLFFQFFRHLKVQADHGSLREQHSLLKVRS